MNNAITEVAKSSGIPGAALLTELLMSYEVPHELYDYLIWKAPTTPLTGMIQPLRRYQQHVKHTGQLASETQEAIDEASDLLRVAQQETLDAGTPGAETVEQLSKIDDLRNALERRRLEQVETLIGEAEALPVPSAEMAGQETVAAISQSTLQASEDALVNAVTALGQGDFDEATEALDAARTLVQTTKQDADEISRRVTHVLDDLESANLSRVTVDASESASPSVDTVDASESIRPSAETIEMPDSGNSSAGTVDADGSINSRGTVNGNRPRSPRSSSPSRGQGMSEDLSEIAGKSLDERDMVRPLIDPDLYTQGMAGEKLRLADEAGLHNGDFDSALAHLDDAKRYAQEMDESTKLLDVAIDSRKTLIAHARDARGFIAQRRAEAHAVPALEEISPAELSVILQKLKAGDFKAGKGGLNAALDITVGGNTFRIKPTQHAKGVEAEVVGGAIADALGFDTPASTMLDAKGVTVSARGDTIHLDKVVVTRSIDELVPLRELEEPVLLSLRADYADQRVLRAFLADSDGHMGNIGLGPNGKLWVIDTDLANFGDTPLLRQAQLPLRNEAELVEAAVTFAHGRLPPSPDVDPQVMDSFLSRIQDSSLYRWIHRADQMIKYEDMSAMVKRINKVMSSKSTILQKLRNRGIDARRAQEIMTILEKRKKVLEEVLSNPTLFGGDGIQMSRAFDETPPVFAKAPWRESAIDSFATSVSIVRRAA